MSDKKYKNEYLRDTFGISHETVRKYTIEFSEFLSEGANPDERGAHRTYTESDLRVFALIVRMKNNNNTDDEIKATLIAAAKGELSELIDDPTVTLSSNMQMTLARQEMTSLRHQRDIALEDSQKWRDLANKLQGQLDEIKARPDNIELHKQIARLEMQIEMLNEQLQDKS
ncbi:MAG: MerR family transcriptional regulator [Phototrophicaceae bacterium]